ncbi:MAG: prolyl oligopeptidase family serine peptidase [Pseudomonadota bacterium]|nr:prolyl oligopeptidase family serine peptidase [Pseudomonadota bacterium]
MRLFYPAGLAALLLTACASVPPAEPLAGPPPSMAGEPNSAAPGGCPECTPVLADLSPAAVKAADPFLWLEEVQGERALAWVRDQNARTDAVLKTDPRYTRFRDQALAILTATDRIPSPSFRAGGIDNFWQDKANVKGLWRRTTLDSYRTANPRWETILDIDALAKAEGRNWVFKGDNCLEPEERFCLVNLSDGGKDAVTVRELDTLTRRFVEGGFTLPEGKHRIDWLDRDTLLVATDFGPGTLTESGYPYIVKLLKRGQTLAQAQEIFRGSAKDGGYGVYPEALRDARGVLQGVLIARPLTTFEAETYWAPAGGALTPTRLDLPAKVSTHGWKDGRLVFTTGQDWRGFKAGSLIAEDMTRLAPGASSERAAALLFEPTPRQAVEDVALTADRIVAVVYDEVRGRLMSFAPGRAGWTSTTIPLPDNSTVTLSATSKTRDQMLVNVQGFVTPSTLFLADAKGGAPVKIKALPDRFNAAEATVEQFTATSRDGTKIPYFVTRPKSLPAAGAPTLLFGYGGFAVAKPPVYIPEMGKLWLENGGVYVNANIRGGGEFGPNWHQSVLKGARQGAFDDFLAVAEDLIRRGITTPDRLGIYGRSNGGVLTSVSITQRPELFDAAVIESPLVDMLRYHELPAGASWIGEYGDPRIPEEAAWIARYSAYHNLKPGVRYPEPYITTNTLDDRVHPGHARKFAARLQSLGSPALYYENTEGGHSNDSDPLMNAERWARHYVYLTRKLMDPPTGGARSAAAR